MFSLMMAVFFVKSTAKKFHSSNAYEFHYQSTPEVSKILKKDKNVFINMGRIECQKYPKKINSSIACQTLINSIPTVSKNL